MKTGAKIKIVVAALAALSLLVLSCGPGQEQAAAQTSTAEIQRGDLSLDITAVGNLSLSQKEDLAFEMDGTVEEVLVEEAQTVEEGQVLARLNTSDWEDSIATLQDKIVNDERQVTTKERAVTAAERALAGLELAVTSKELAVTQRQLDVDTAEYNLSQLADVKKLQDQIDDAKVTLDFINKVLGGEIGGITGVDYSYWTSVKTKATNELTQAEQDMKDLLAGRNITISTTVAMQISQKQLAVDQANLNLQSADDALDDAKVAVEDGQYNIETAKIAVEDARKTLKNDQDDLATLQGESHEIIAPFAGFITKVNVEGGDEVKKGTVAVTIADPNKFEADIYVNENDVFQISLNGTATVQVDAANGLTLPATVTHIAPTATIQQGVVNYKVKVEVRDLSPEERQQAQQDTSSTPPQLTEGQLPPRLQQAVDAGVMTEEQANQMMDRIRSGDFQLPQGVTGGGFPSGTGNGTGGNFPGGVAGGFGGNFQGGALFGGQGNQVTQFNSADVSNVQLREGLSVTVSILTDQRTNVLLVPNSAITSRGGQTYVQVLLPSGDTEERAIQVGIADWQYTEVLDGLSEGETVVISNSSAASTTTSTNTQRDGNAIRFPGLGR